MGFSRHKKNRSRRLVVEIGGRLAPLPYSVQEQSMSKEVDLEAGERANTVMFTDDDIKVMLRFDSEDQSIWATYQNIADLFEVDVSVANKHVNNVYSDKELDKEGTRAKFALVQNEGGRYVVREGILHFNLDMIISVGYRVNAKRAVKFRQWATRTLKAYIEQGYVINEKALRESPEKLNKLAAAVRALRNDEKQIYAKVRECFKICSADYDPNSSQVKTFTHCCRTSFTMRSPACPAPS
jgi:Virulence protein